MKVTRKRVLGGLAAAGVLAGVATGTGVALAASGPAQATAATTAATVTAAPGQCDGDHLAIRAGRPAMTAAASYLGLTQAQLASKLQSGQSLADVAKAEGKSVSGLENAILTAMTNQINANAKLSATQKADLINEVKSHLSEMVTRTHPDGPGMRWARSPAGERGQLPGGMHGMRWQGMAASA